MLRELGQVQAARDAYEAARDAYEKVLALELAKDESQARYRLLSITYGRLGDLQLALGDKGAAREAYEKRLALALEAAKDESNLEAQCHWPSPTPALETFWANRVTSRLPWGLTRRR